MEPRAAGDTFLAQIYLDGVSGLARDRCVLTSHWQALTSVQSALDLATALKSGIVAWLISAYAGKITIYKSDFAPPGTIHPPLASIDIGIPSAPIADQGPPELALCLSYFSVYNVKRFRGRNYIPFKFIYAAMGGTSQPAGVRPSGAMMTQALNLWTKVYMPVDHNTNWDWVLRSPTDKAFKPITDVWVDDEWDHLSSRGLRGTTRQTAKT